jgi:ferredoxin
MIIDDERDGGYDDNYHCYFRRCSTCHLRDTS